MNESTRRELAAVSFNNCNLVWHGSAHIHICFLPKGHIDAEGRESDHQCHCGQTRDCRWPEGRQRL